MNGLVKQSVSEKTKTSDLAGDAPVANALPHVSIFGYAHDWPQEYADGRNHSIQLAFGLKHALHDFSHCTMKHWCTVFKCLRVHRAWTATCHLHPLTRNTHLDVYLALCVTEDNSLLFLSSVGQKLGEDKACAEKSR